MFDIGDSVPLSWAVTVDGVATNGTVVLTLTAPDGTSSTPTVSNPSTGIYTAAVTVTQSGTYRFRWVSTGAVEAAEEGTFDVRRQGSGVIRVDEVKSRLRKPGTVGDDKIQEMIDAAEAEYARWVGPLSGTVTETVDGGGDLIVLKSPNVSAITAAAYTDGTEISVDDLDLDTATGFVRWGYGTAGYFTRGTHNVTLTYTIAALPPDHREAIIADVAGYFAATQRAGDERVDDNGYATGFYTTPMNLFPRIRALAVPGVA